MSTPDDRDDPVDPLDALLRRDQPEPSPDFDARFFARLEAERAAPVAPARPRRLRTWWLAGGAAVAAAAAAVLLLAPPEEPPEQDVPLIAELDLLEVYDEVEVMEALDILEDPELFEVVAALDELEPPPGRAPR